MIHVMIHMTQYSICINDTFCQIFDQKNLICRQISLEFGNFNDQNNINLSKTVSFEVSCNKMNDTICII